MATDINKSRMAEIQANVGAQASMEQQQMKMERQKQMEEARANMLVQIATPAARERLSRIALVKPDYARRVEDMLLGMAQQGRLQSTVDETQLKQVLEQIQPTSPKQKIVIQRKKYMGDSDDDDNFDDL